MANDNSNKPAEASGPNYWWLNANPKKDEGWNLSSAKVGDVQAFSSVGKKNNRPNVDKVKRGDIVIGYQTGGPLKKGKKEGCEIAAICEILGEHDDVTKEIQIVKVKDVKPPISLGELRRYLKERPELIGGRGPFARNKKVGETIMTGTLLKLSKDCYDFVMDLIRKRGNGEPSVNPELEKLKEQHFQEWLKLKEEHLRAPEKYRKGPKPPKNPDKPSPTPVISNDNKGPKHWWLNITSSIDGPKITLSAPEEKKFLKAFREANVGDTVYLSDHTYSLVAICKIDEKQKKKIQIVDEKTLARDIPRRDIERPKGEEKIELPTSQGMLCALTEEQVGRIKGVIKKKHKDVTKKYWWLNAKPEHKDFSEITVGEVDSSGLLDEQHLSQDFSEVKIGDRVIWHQKGSDQKLLVLCDIVKEQNGEKIIIKKKKELISYTSLEEIPGLADFKGKGGVPVELTKDKYHSIMTLVLRKKFLTEVFMGEDQYEKLVRLLKNKKNIILQGPPGVGKTFAARRLAWSMMGDIDEDRIKLVQFHQSYSYEDFVEGYKPRNKKDPEEAKEEGEFVLRPGVFRKFCDEARGKEEPYFFIIDEINRGNMSKIFGELLMLIEKDYRGDKYSLELAYSREKFSVPENLYIIGMMNTADRSLAMLDYALRRRFGFFEMKPAFDSEGFKKYQDSIGNPAFTKLIEWVNKELNEEIKKDDSLGDGFCIGHSYFCGWENEENLLDKMQDVVECDIIPTLKEYWFDNPKKLQDWTVDRKEMPDDLKNLLSMKNKS